MRNPLIFISVSITLLFSQEHFVYAVNNHETFFVDPSYDLSGRTRVASTLIHEGNNAYFFVDDELLALLSNDGRAELTEALKDLSYRFDVFMYPYLIYYLDTEWKPGIDNDHKITILFYRMRTSAGGYFRKENEFPRSAFLTSNEREMLYLNTRFLAKPQHRAEFLAHEFQHLINFNQKKRLRGVEEEFWLNEMLSEVAPALARLYMQDNFSLDSSHLKDSINIFLSNKDNPFGVWSNTQVDYASVQLFGIYLYDRYGPTFFRSVIQSNKTGFDALREGLVAAGEKRDLESVFMDWLTTVTVNTCSVERSDIYCYKNKHLNYDNFHISLTPNEKASEDGVITKNLQPWQGNWIRFEKEVWDFRRAQHYAIFEIISEVHHDVRGKYVVYGVDGTINVFDIPFKNGRAEWIIPDFGYTVSKIDAIFAAFSEEGKPVGFELREQTRHVPFTLSGKIKGRLTPLQEGDLVRVIGNKEIYVLKGGFRRWIQTPVIFDSYEHLKWENVKEVSQEVLDSFVESSLVRLESDPKVYIISLGSRISKWYDTQKAEKSWLTCIEDLEGTSCDKRWLAQGGNPEAIFTINSGELNAYKVVDHTEL